MNKLTRIQFDRARNYIKTHARSLERTLFEQYFEGGSVEAVQVQLGKFQNPDGGFGNALEPDMRSPSSSALATEAGLRMLVELGVPSTHVLVRAAVDYALGSIDRHTRTWRIAPLDVNEHPHAPWWHDEGCSLARTFDDYLVAPRAGILAHLYHYAGLSEDLVPAGWLGEITRATLADVKGMADEMFGGGGDALDYLRRLSEAPGLPEPEKGWLVRKVQALADHFVTRDPEQWSSYCAPPLKLAPTPDAITAEVLLDCLPTHLDYVIDQQTPQGYWDVNWQWSDYPDVWEIARGEWRGILTLDTLTTLESFGRIEI